MKRKLKPQVKILMIILIILLIVFGTYIFLFSPTSTKSEKVELIIEKGNTYLSIADKLKSKNLIRSKIIYKIYIKTNNVDGLHEGKYILNKNMTIKEIVSKLKQKSTYNPNVLRITFKEGINMRKVALLIEQNTNHTKEEVFNLLKDQTYLDSLISKYWFLSNSIKDEKIYYSLEGYLFPDTYEFSGKDVEIKEIFNKMLDETENKLEKYKNKIKSDKYSIHELITLASIIELEAANSDDRNGVSGVFYNRLESNWSLGSDVTTYYGVKVDVNERDLYQKEIEQYNSYNTRSTKMMGKLPIGPICNPSIESIEAVLYPKEHNYFYFVADKNKKTYFSKTSSEHIKIVNKLKEEGKWYEY